MDVDWAVEFSRVISCARCNQDSCKNILRDSDENVPQPGYIGVRFIEKRILLVGQNPGVTRVQTVTEARNYTASLRRLRDEPSSENFLQLRTITRLFIPYWPIQKYFPLRESGLTFDDIAYCNIARCRTQGNASPSSRMASNCANSHFGRWLDLLRPRFILFIGKWAYDRGLPYSRERGIPCDFMNRRRSLSTAARRENRERVTALIGAHLEKKLFGATEDKARDNAKQRRIGPEIAAEVASSIASVKPADVRATPPNAAAVWEALKDRLDSRIQVLRPDAVYRGDRGRRAAAMLDMDGKKLSDVLACASVRIKKANVKWAMGADPNKPISGGAIITLLPNIQ
jgi:hypothetical protein